MTPPPANISVVEPLNPALERVKTMLFRPFDLGKWFTIGFCAWLAFLGEGGGFNPGSNFGGGNRSSGGGNFRQEFGHVRDYVLGNLAWLVPLVVAVFLFFLALGLLIIWLNSRGKFMFLHCVALDKAEVAEPWRRFGRQGNSLFLFRLVMALIGWVLFLPLLVLMVLVAISMAQRDAADAGGILAIIGLLLVLIGLGVVFGIVRKLTTDLAVPIMFLRQTGCLAAWKELWSLLSAHIGAFILYFLFSILLSMAIGALVVFVFLVTCCVACCLSALPYIGTVLLLPVLTFKRSYSLYFLAQFGPEYNVFAPPAPHAAI